jgi:hypothetical protein
VSRYGVSETEYLLVSSRRNFFYRADLFARKSRPPVSRTKCVSSSDPMGAEQRSVALPGARQALLHEHITASGQAGLMRCRRARVSAARSGIGGFCFPPDVIMVAVRWHLRYALSYRDVEELLAERSIKVDHVTIFRWMQRFTPLLIDAARPCRHALGDRWFVDETYAKIAGRGAYLYRAID